MFYRCEKGGTHVAPPLLTNGNAYPAPRLMMMMILITIFTTLMIPMLSSLAGLLYFGPGERPIKMAEAFHRAVIEAAFGSFLANNQAKVICILVT